MSSAFATDFREIIVPKGFRSFVTQRAGELYACGDGREISAVIADETGQPETVIDWIITGEAIAKDRALRTLTIGVTEALQESRETADDVTGEPCRIRARRAA